LTAQNGLGVTSGLIKPNPNQPAPGVKAAVVVMVAAAAVVEILTVTKIC